eukprot:3880822-Alexandrium_andersonii.AAC.1
MLPCVRGALRLSVPGGLGPSVSWSCGVGVGRNSAAGDGLLRVEEGMFCVGRLSVLPSREVTVSAKSVFPACSLGVTDLVVCAVGESVSIVALAVAGLNLWKTGTF